MTVKTQMPIVIFRGDNTAAFDLRTIRILLTGDLDLSHATAKFTLLDFSKTWTEQEVATGELSITFTSEQTKAFALGPQTGTLRLYDMSTGTPRQLTIVNKIPFFVTNRVCEIDSQSYEADVCVSGGDVIHIEFKVGAGAVEGKADKVKNATTGDLASLTADGNLEDSGIPKTDVLRKTQMDSTPTEGSQNPVTSDGIKRAIDAATPSDYAQVKAQVAANTGDIAEIESLIPAQASEQNKLADRNFVNSSIQTNTATFRGSYNLVSDLGLTVSATEQQVATAIAAKLASLVPPVVPENNDYVFVQVPKTDAEPTVIERVDRYKCTVTESGGVTTRVWEYEWSLNNSSFTADQWAAINSGITAGLVEKLNGIEAGAQVNAIQTVKVNGTALTPDASKAVDVTVPKSYSFLPVIAGTANAGLSNAYSRGDHVHPAETEIVKYRLPDYCFPITYQDSTFPSGQQNRTIASNDGIRFEVITFPLNIIILHDIASESAGGYASGFCAFLTTTLTFNTVTIATDNLKFNGTTPTANTWPILEKDVVFVREVRVANEADVETALAGKLGNSGDQTLNGTLAVKGTRIEEYKIVYDVGAAGESNLMFPAGKNDYLALLSDILVKSVKLNGTALTPDANGAVNIALTTDDLDYSSGGGSMQLTLALDTIFSTIAALAPLASPAFTGTPTAPTPTAGDDSTKVATTAFVKTAVEGVTPNLDYVMRVDPETGEIYYTTPDANA